MLEVHRSFTAEAEAAPRSVRAADHETEWRALVEKYLPVVPAKSGWRYRPPQVPHPAQGWKLHISATLPNAITVFERCAPLLVERGVAFKSVKTLNLLSRLNSAIPFGFSQIGKFITVYPRDAAQAVELAELLHAATRDFPAPAVPFDRQLRPGSAVYFRYGAFGHEEMETEDGSRVSVLRTPSGERVPDLREPGKAVPDWVECPFAAQSESASPPTPLQTRFLCYEAFMQRGKGGVYRAVDIERSPARLCVVKEGRRHGETNWLGQDGRSYVEREEAILRAMHGLAFAAPAVIDSFCIGEHRYLVIEHIDGEPLLMACADPQKKLPIDEALAYGAAVAQLVAQLHAAGWVWRDLKPANVLVDRSGRLRPVDFEGALRLQETSNIPWGTPSYMPPEARHGAFAGSHVREDLYGLGATLHQLLSSWLMHRDDVEPGAQASATQRPPLGRLRKQVPPALRDLVAQLLHTDPLRRPSAQSVVDALAPYARSVLPVPTPAKRDSAVVRRVREKMWQEVQDMLIAEPALAAD